MKVQTYNDTSAMAAGRLDGTGEIPMRITKSVYNIPLNRDRNNWFKTLLLFKYTIMNNRRCVVLNILLYKYGGDLYVYRAKT